MTRFRAVHRSRHITYELGQIGMAQQLADGLGFAGVEPVVLGIPQTRGADTFR